MLAYCASVWQFRYFWSSLVLMDLRTRYRGSVLGMGWSLLQPIAMTVIFCFIFCPMFGQSVRHYASYVLVGMAFWGYLSYSIVQGCSCFFQGEQYIRQFPAPMGIYALRTVLGGSFHFLLALGIALALALVVLHQFTWALLTLVPTLVLLIVLGWSCAMLAGLATVFFRDTKHLSEIGLQLAFYLTPIMYPIEVARDRGLGVLVDWNPIVPFLLLLRDPITKGLVPEFTTFARAGCTVVLVFAAATYALSRLERRIIFDL